MLLSWRSLLFCKEDKIRVKLSVCTLLSALSSNAYNDQISLLCKNTSCTIPLSAVLLCDSNESLLFFFFMLLPVHLAAPVVPLLAAR